MDMDATTLECIEIQTGPNPARSVIWLHGLGADGNDFAPIVPELDLKGMPALRFLFPHAPVRPVTVNNGMSMRAWYDIFTPDLVRQEDEAGIRQSEQAIRALIARENVRGIACEHIVLAGFSQGSAMTLHTGLCLDEQLAGLIALSGYLPLSDRFAAERKTANQATPSLLARRSMEPVVAMERGEGRRDQLLEVEYTVSWKTYPMPHSVCPEEIDDIGQFLHQVLA